MMKRAQPEEWRSLKELNNMETAREQWCIAQEEERKQHTNTMEEGLAHYGEGYRQYFEHLGIEPDQKGKRIIEIGCADFPALHFCKNYVGIVIEPMSSPILRKLIIQDKLLLLPLPAEDALFPYANEVWLFNVLQHVIDPSIIIKKAKEYASIVRFFEPINCPKDKCHLHTFTLDYFRQMFGDCVKHYIAEEGVKNFHQAECAYGIWRKK